MLKRMTTMRTLEKFTAGWSITTLTEERNEKPVAAETQVKASVQADKKPLRVFMADDSRMILERLSALLVTIEGLQIIGSAQTGSAAIRAVHHLTPDLVILDFQMPDGNGLDVLKAIKQGDAPPLVMMLTNLAYPPYQTECVRWGANYFFDKSQDFERVMETCRSLVAGKES